jgi:hypothetical protein
MMLWADTMVEEAEAELGSTSIAAVQARRNVLDTKKWLLQKLVPDFRNPEPDHRHLQVFLTLPKKQGVPDPRYPGSARLIEAMADEDEHD